MIICIAGAIASGKSTLSKALETALNARAVGFGDYIRERARESGADASDRKQLQDLGQELVEEDPQLFVDKVLTWAGHRPSATIILDGVRHLSVWRALQQRATSEPVWLLFLQVGDDERRRRARGRGFNAQEISEMEAHPAECDVPALQAVADLVLDGLLPVDSLVSQVQSKLLPSAL